MAGIGDVGTSWLTPPAGAASAFGLSNLSPATQSNALGTFQDFAYGGPQGLTNDLGRSSGTMAAIGSMLNDYGQRTWGAKYGPQQSGAIGSGTSGPMASLGGDWAGVDQWDSQITSAANSFKVPPNLIKSVMQLESGGQNLPANGAGAVGPMQVVASVWGSTAASMGLDLNNPADNIAMGAFILNSNYNQFKDWATQNGVDPWKAAVYSYYAGNPYDLNAADDPNQGGSGMSTGAYGDQIWQSYQNLNSFGGTGAGLSGNPQQINGQWGGTQGGQNIVDVAQQYLGTPYVWGSAPGKGQSPSSWDCSGFTYWLDQNYGDGSLPQGSHQQYQQAIAQGRLFQDTSQLQPGDLLYFYTEDDPGYSDHASHVAVYIGNGQIIHAANPDAGTIISNLSDPYYQSRFIGGEHMAWSGGGYTGTPGTAPVTPTGITNPYYTNWAQNR